jgi:hypothetical protein
MIVVVAAVVVAAAGLGVEALTAQATASRPHRPIAAHARGVQPVRTITFPRVKLNTRKLGVLALQAAARNGDAHPTNVAMVRTTHRRALAVMEPGMPVARIDRTSVYLITMNGKFTAYDASPPAGSALPTGRHLTMIIDARTGQGLDGGLEPYRPRLSTIARPVRLPG